jgi:hypothetical protein
MTSGLCLVNSCKKEPNKPTGSFQLYSVNIGPNSLDLQGLNPGMPVDRPLILTFSNKIDTASAKTAILLTFNKAIVPSTLSFAADLKSITLSPLFILTNSASYVLDISDQLKGFAGETFPGVKVNFATAVGKLQIITITLNGNDFKYPSSLKEIQLTNLQIEVAFSSPIDSSNYQPYFTLTPNAPLSINLSGDHKKVSVSTTANLQGYTKYYFYINPNLTSQDGLQFDGFNNSFFTTLDSSYKFPLIPDNELLDLVQHQTFRYFYDFAHPACGMARERNTSGDEVATGGSGFGVMALIVGMERGFITREEGTTRLALILGFLETCDRFHGAWPHWINGSTGKAIMVFPNDDGADLVETSYMAEGLITMRQYLDPGNPVEAGLINRINALLDAVEYDWFTQGQNVLYWHWSPNNGFIINMKIEGYNEALITYMVAASSTTHTILPAVYHEGYARNGAIVNGSSYYGYVLPLGYAYGGPLFFTHYTFLGVDPRNLSDQYANYWEQNVNQSLINWAYCADNPKKWLGYSTDSWGLTASDNPWGYDAQSPTHDLGVITPTAAVSALPYTPEQSMAAIRHFYYILGDRLWGPYGFYDAFDVTEGWWANSNIAIDEGPIICMIENYRTGLLWNLFMSSPEVKQGLTKLGFSY